ncbi:conserved exported hypothetical protein [Syntrophobacter sp. SbD1]|nr:conserved exported hypothetical protein [Syntrophobacter sp. SbD1]
MRRYLLLLFLLHVLISLSHLVFAQDSEKPIPRTSPSAKAFGHPKWSTAEIGGVQWLIDPEGKPFYSKGINFVSPGLDSEKSRAGKAYCWLNFCSGIGEWRKQITDRLRDWGFNTLGGWSDCSPNLGLPLMVDLELGRNSHFHWFDPFDPQMEQKTLEKAVELTAAYRDKPQLIGYFSDNEVGWWNSSLFIWFLKAPWENCTKRFLWKMIYDNYEGSWEALLADWSPPVGAGNFDDLKKAGASLKLRPGGNGIRLVDKFMNACAKRYYELMYKAIHAAHPGALVLGDRLPLYYHQDAILAMGDNVDVISTNYNVDIADGWVAPYYFDGLRKLSHKPVLITEFFFAAAENRSGNLNETARNIHSKPGHLMTVATQAERAWGAGNALISFARFPNVAGAHWFQYCDEPCGGREDGEDYNMGLVDTSNRPYETLTGDFKKLNPELESVHAMSAAREKAAGAAQGENSSGAGPVKIPGADYRIDLSDQTLIGWEKEKTLLSGFRAPAPYVPFGEVHLTWKPEGFYLFSLSNTYVDPNFLDYRNKFPKSDSFQLHFTIEAEGKQNHLAVYLIPQNNPSYPDGFEIKTELFRIEKGLPEQKLPSQGHVLRIEKSLPHMVVEAFFPAKWFGVDELKPGMRLRANIALVSYFREFEMTWAGNPQIKEISDPRDFREIELE